MKNSWYSIQAKGSEAKISIHDEIGLYGVDAKTFMAELDSLEGISAINLSIHSPGVDVIEGNNLIWLHLAITFAVSTASFYLVEQPVVRRRVPRLDRPMKPIPALAASAGAVVTILGGLLWVNTRPADEAAASSLGAIDLLAGVDFDNYQPANGAANCENKNICGRSSHTLA